MASESTDLSKHSMNMKEEAYRPLAIRFTKSDGTKVSYNLGCGLSLKDLALILGCYLVFYSFLVIFCAILLKGVMDTTEHHTLLWTFNFIGMIFGGVMGIAVKMGTMSQQEEKAATLEDELKRAKLKSQKAKHEMLP